MKYQALVRQHPLISDQVDAAELSVILDHLERTLQREEVGAIVEFGCYAGTTSLFIRRLLDVYEATSAFHVYDSFEGLPDKTAEDASPAGEQFKAGELSVSKKDFLRNFKKAGLSPPIVHKGWFSQVTDDEVPSGISFAFLDGDYYESIKDPLALITDKMAPSGVIIVDDYGNISLPGARRAVDEWRQANAHRITHFQEVASLAVITLK